MEHCRGCRTWPNRTATSRRHRGTARWDRGTARWLARRVRSGPVPPATPAFAVLLAALLPVVAALSGCGSSSTVEADDVEAQVSEALAAEVGEAPDGVSCPGDLEAEVGATIRCELEAGGLTYGVTVRVTGIDGDAAALDIRVDDDTAG